VLTSSSHQQRTEFQSPGSQLRYPTLLPLLLREVDPQHYLYYLYTICTIRSTTVLSVHYLYYLYTICTICTLSVLSVHYLYYLYTICTICTLSVLSVHYLYYLYTICTICTLSVLSVHYLYYLYTICTICTLSVLSVHYLYYLYTICTLIWLALYPLDAHCVDEPFSLCALVPGAWQPVLLVLYVAQYFPKLATWLFTKV